MIAWFERLLLLWLMITSGLAMWWPISDFDPFLKSSPYLYWLIRVTMFHVGIMLPRDELDQLKKRWGSVLFGTTIQYTAMPLLGWSVAKLFNLPPSYQIGLILVGCVPGAMASNVITMNARGHTSYSVSLTTASTMLSPIVVPFTLWLTLGDSASLQSRSNFNPLDTAIGLFCDVVLPTLLGLFLARKFPRIEAWGNRWGSVIANVVILWIVATVVAMNRTSLVAGTIALIWPLLAVNLLGYLAGYVAGTLAKQPESMRRALTIEVGMQNAGLGTVLAGRLFPDQPGATVPTALYTFGCVLTAMILARWWSYRSDAISNEANETA